MAILPSGNLALCLDHLLAVTGSQPPTDSPQPEVRSCEFQCMPLNARLLLIYNYALWLKASLPAAQLG
jgi:hypothetical protein